MARGRMLQKMPGDRWQKFANLRAYYGFMWGHPGKKLLFMGSEFGQEREWNHDRSLDWHLLDDPMHEGVRRTVRDLNALYRSEPGLHQRDCVAEGFAGSRAAIPKTTCSPSPAMARTAAGRSWSSRTWRRWCAKVTASASRKAAPGPSG